MGGSLARNLSRFDKIISTFFFRLLPEILRFIVLSICVLRKYYKQATTDYRYRLAINSKSSEFVYTRQEKQDLVECRICLSDFEDEEEGRQVVYCKHAFHKHCLEKWLKGYYKASCPLCRGLVVPELVLAEYQRRLNEEENNIVIEKELALILLNVLHAGSTCNGYF
ncbi:hypothetical protein F511_30702 [Dorcoceras hygrometricum]|uniref:RING-type domain-containing protein n=1 Tax=Dorcoceras hygrometricum TaxID=472368 RepID=A0A2Z7AWZ9_9LAMI|nr:hypothetical protein F511_30702 [Dorcoceras hygrometricum]